jgi:hypothetical protein
MWLAATGTTQTRGGLVSGALTGRPPPAGPLSAGWSWSWRVAGRVDDRGVAGVRGDRTR